jgi:alanyl-tRNA synthetase
LQELVNYEYLKREYGYQRYKCKVCGEHFWSRVPRETCPDRPCSKYEFLYKKYERMRPLSVQEVREKFINFLESRGHGVVDPYPVLAKWRNDLYLTIASIVVFQPEATDGLIEPPHNPLVIIQPSIRLTDIDNVGLTFGRHLSSFEMGGMHAFNKPGKFIYWSEGILSNTIDFFTKEVGVDLDDLVFKEGWWEGGGNAGPAPEVLVDGMEVATLVHMAYKVVNGRYEVNPVLVVDCGYGIERIAWLTQQSPTGFHAIYGKLIDEYKNILSVEEPPYEVLKKIVYSFSDREVASVEDFVELLQTHEFRDYVKEVVDSIYMYSALDHVRTLSLMLSDGIVPSNTGEGYLARLVLRRLLRNLVKLRVDYGKLQDVVLELFDRQISFWRGDYIYGKFEKHRDYILDVVATETARYINTMQRGVEYVDKLLRKKRVISLDDLIELYDSHGIPPELIAERAQHFGIEVHIPRDFYSMIAKRHSSPPQLVKIKERELPEDVVKWASEFRETKRVFHEDPYSTRVEARVLGVYGNYVVLDKTVAYPWAGGQDHDEGYIRFGDDVYKLVFVGKVGDVVVHVLDRQPSFKPGDVVVVEIDWNRRYTLMRHHTATHIVLAAARRVLGDHVWQAGAEKTVDKARLDITHHKPLTPELVEKIERVANEIVNSRLPLRFTYLDRFEAEKIHGVKIHQGGAVYAEKLRIVEIPGWDAQACFGTHLFNTAEVGGIKIINYERIQDGVVRLEFIAGPRLVEHIKALEKQTEEVASLVGAKGKDLVASIKKLIDDNQELSNLIGRYREFVERSLVAQAESSSIDICGLRTLVLELPVKDEKLAKSLIDELVFKRKMLVALLLEDVLEVSIDPQLAKDLNIDLRKLTPLLIQHGFKGGGKQDHVVYRFAGPLSKDIILTALHETICKK